MPAPFINAVGKQKLLHQESAFLVGFGIFFIGGNHWIKSRVHFEMVIAVAGSRAPNAAYFGNWSDILLTEGGTDLNHSVRNRIGRSIFLEQEQIWKVRLVVGKI